MLVDVYLTDNVEENVMDVNTQRHLLRALEKILALSTGKITKEKGREDEVGKEICRTCETKEQTP